MTSELDRIGQRWNTDKAKFWSDDEGRSGNGHDFLVTYERFFCPLRHKPIVLLEIGMGADWNAAASLKTWAEYFIHHETRIIGIDNREYYRSFRWPRCDAIVMDASTPGALEGLGRDLQPDIVIDDGSHLWAHQNQSLCALFPFVKLGGIFVIEDIHTSFGGLRAEYSRGADIDMYSRVLAIQTDLVARGADHPIRPHLPARPHLDMKQIEAVCALRDAVIIQKA